MKKLFILLNAFLFIVVMPACKKEQHVTSDNVATLNVINGVINKSALIKMNGSINNSGINSSGGNQNEITYGSNLFFFNEAKNTDLSVLSSTDKSVLVSKNIDFRKGGIYTMLLAGIAPNAEAVVIDDSNIPKVDISKMPVNADSVIYVRFINLSPNVQPLNIRLQGSSTNDVNGLAYKNYTAFKAYPAKITSFSGTIGLSRLIFEFVENGSVLLTSSVTVTSTNRFKNIALVLTGMKTPGPGQPGLVVSRVNYFQ